MNLSRSLSRLLLSSSAIRKWSIHRPVSLLHSYSLSTQTLNPKPSSYRRNPKSSEELPRPSEIPFQAKVANSVHLVGKVGSPVQLRTLPNGIYAVSILVQEKTKNSSYLSVPVIFQGDLAQIAACHLKESNLVYVTGQLSGDIPALAVKDAETSLQIQVLVNTLSFVRKTYQENENVVLYGQEEVTSNSSGGMKEPDNSESLWSDLVEHPQQWYDNRMGKLNGSVEPKYPDFKQKSTQKELWLCSAPGWILEKLDGLKFSDSNSITKDYNAASIKKLEKENLWKKLAENPSKWWDNRSKKLKPNHPDFKHKETGEALWLGSSTPSWVFPKLPPLKSKEGVDSTTPPTNKHFSLITCKKR